MSNIRTNYEKWYEGDGYYWGTEPARFCDELIALCPPSKDKKVLDIGCGEGKDAVYMATKGYTVTAFDLTENGIRKTLRLAEERGTTINAYVDDINTFETDEQFDIINHDGIPCSLLTGEEEISVVSSRITASTIEMADLEKHYAVAVR